MGKDKKKSKKVKPQLLKGFKDYPAEDEFVRRELISKVQSVFEEYGYQPLVTPALEHIETLLGADYGEEGSSQIFNFTGPEDVHMGLRFDLTAPLARYVASQPNLPRPFRRYQASPVWRCDKPGPGRFREFMQFDIDIVGTTMMAADAEIILVMTKTMLALGIDKFVVRYSNRRILNGLAEYAGLPAEQAPDMFRVLDKLDKQGREAVVAELGAGRTDKSGDIIKGLNLKPEQISRIEKFLDIPKGILRRLSNNVRSFWANMNTLNWVWMKSVRLKPIWMPPRLIRSMPCSILPSCAVWDITPARFLKPTWLICPSLERSLPGDGMTIWWDGLPDRRPPGWDHHLD